MLTLKEYSKKKSKVKINPMTKDLMEKPESLPKEKKEMKSKKLDDNEGLTVEAKVDKGRSDYGKASIRNYRRKGPGHGEPGMFDPEGKRGKTIDQRQKEHKARRGVKGAKVPAYKREDAEVLDELKTSTLLSYTQSATNRLAFDGKGDKKSIKRAKGIKNAAGKLAMRATDPDGKMGFNKNPKNEATLATARKNIKMDPDKPSCWKGYKATGTKMKGGKAVPDCKKEELADEGTSYGLYKGSGKAGGAMKAYLDNKAKKLEAKKKKQKPEYANNPAFGDPSHHSNAKNKTEELKGFNAYLESSCDTKEKAKNDAVLKRKEDLKVAKYNTKKEEIAYADAEKVREEVQEKTYSTKTLDAIKAKLTERATALHLEYSKVKKKKIKLEATRLKKELGYDVGGTKKPSGKKVVDAALQAAKKSIAAKYGKGAIMRSGSNQAKKVKGAKSTVGTNKYKDAADKKKATAASAKKRGFKSTQNYVDTMARYGGKKNYDKGKGLGT